MVQGTKLEAEEFRQYWINYDKGTFWIGTGAPGSGPFFSWTDEQPIECILYAGLSSWDRHNCYRHTRMLPALTSFAPSPTEVLPPEYIIYLGLHLCNGVLCAGDFHNRPRLCKSGGYLHCGALCQPKRQDGLQRIVCGGPAVTRTR